MTFTYDVTTASPKQLPILVGSVRFCAPIVHRIDTNHSLTANRGTADDNRSTYCQSIGAFLPFNSLDN